MDQQPISALKNVNGTILHLGAGECRELESYLETAAEWIVLVEPDPQFAQTLRLRSHAEPRVKVIEAAVSDQEGEGELHHYSVTGLATLHPLKVLPKQWPGLRKVVSTGVKTIDMAQLLEQVVLASDKQHWLLIETPGEERQVLQAIRRHEAPQPFDYITLILSNLTPEVEQARPMLLEMFEEAGYRLEHMTTKTDQMAYHAKADIQWKEYQELKAECGKLKILNTELTQQLVNSEEAGSQGRLAHLERKLDLLFSEQRSYIQQTTNALGQHVTRCAQQQRDEQALAYYLEHGQPHPGSQLSPALARALLELRDAQRYDSVVIFGSGPMTELFARAILQDQGSQRRLVSAGQEDDAGPSGYAASSQSDLSPSILSVEHQQTLCDQLEKKLAAQDLQKVVNIVNSPWTECRYQDQTALFYSSEQVIGQLNQWLRAEGRSLVIVGEALAQSQHSRAAALPLLLQHLEAMPKELDVVLEHAPYSQESTLLKQWNTLLDARQQAWQLLEMPDALGWRIKG